MDEFKKSSSKEQMEAEDVIFKLVESSFGCELKRNQKIYLLDNAFTYIQPDFYSEELAIVGEIFAHIGKLKKAQDNKISNDILKMLLLEKIQQKSYRKIIVVCDKELEKKLYGLSALAEGIRQFGVEIIKIDVPSDLKEEIIKAQHRQKMVNA